MDDYIPLSFINAFAYCPRRFYYEYVQAEMLLNEYVVDGQQLHERADSGQTSWREGVVQERRMQLWSDRLRLIGVADVVEWRDGVVAPVEYKRGKLGAWQNDHAQLCGQALCLEERLGFTITHGYLFSFAERRREEVEFTAELRAWTEALVAEAHTLARSGIIPPPTTKKTRCRACSLEPFCLPNEVRQLAAVSDVTLYPFD